MQQTDCTRRRVIGLAGTTVVVGLAGCNGGGGGNGNGNGTDSPIDGTETPAGEEETQLRVVHASPTVDEVDVSVGGEEVLTGVAFRDVSDYMDVESGSTQLQIMPAGEDEAVYDEEVEVSEGPNTAVALGELDEDAGTTTPDGTDGGNVTDGDNGTDGNVTDGTDTETPDGTTPTDGDGGDGQSFSVEVFEDDHELPDSEMANFRLVHAVPDADAVDVTASMEDAGTTPEDGTAEEGTETETDTTGGNETDGTETDDGNGTMDGDALVSDVGFGEASDYEEVDAGDYTLSITSAGDGGDGGDGFGDGTETDGNETDETDGTGGNETDGTDGTETDAEDGATDGEEIASADVTLDGETVYSAFAMGYAEATTAPVSEPLEVELATDADPSTADETPTDGTETSTDDGGGFGGNETDGTETATPLGE